MSKESRKIPKTFKYVLYVVLSIILIIIALKVIRFFIGKYDKISTSIEESNKEMLELKKENELIEKQYAELKNPEILKQNFEFCSSLLKEPAEKIYINQIDPIHDDSFNRDFSDYAWFIICHNGINYNISLAKLINLINNTDLNDLTENKTQSLNNSLKPLYCEAGEFQNYSVIAENISPEEFYLKYYNERAFSILSYFLGNENIKLNEDGIKFYQNQLIPYPGIKDNSRISLTSLKGNVFASYKEKDSNNIFIFTIDNDCTIYFSKLELTESTEFYEQYSAEKIIKKLKSINQFEYKACYRSRKLNNVTDSDYDRLLENYKYELSNYEDLSDEEKNYYIDWHELDLSTPWWCYEAGNFIFTGSGKDPSFGSLDFNDLLDVYIKIDDGIYKSLTEERYLLSDAFCPAEYDYKDVSLTESDLFTRICKMVDEKVISNDSIDLDGWYLYAIEPEYRELIGDLVYAHHGVHIPEFNKRFAFEKAIAYTDKGLTKEEVELTDQELRILEHLGYNEINNSED